MRDFISDKEHVVDIYFLADIINDDKITHSFDPSTSKTIRSIEWVPLTRLNEIKSFPAALKTKLPKDYANNFATQGEHLGNGP